GPLKSMWNDPTYTREIHYRKTSGNTRLTIFEGGHEEVKSASLSWLAQQRRDIPAKWNIQPEDGAFGTEEVTK
ncbi:MAG TPA: hypothetical protein PLU78_03505, partial [Chitinophagales bacterium]|nr:hypothetical protein [Chitinophagales bacterium]